MLSSTFGNASVLLLLLLVAKTSSSQGRSAGALVPAPTSRPLMTIELGHELPEGYVLPPSIELSGWCPPAGDQGRQYSCTAWALGYGLMSYRINRAVGRTYQIGDTLDPADAFSPAYLFNLMKQIKGGACNSGLDIEKLADIARFSGCCSLAELPYDTTLSSCHNLNPPAVYLKGIPHHTPGMTQLGDSRDLEQWKYHLSAGRPILVTLVIDDDFRDGGYATEGLSDFLWHWDPMRTGLDGHAVLCTGYRDDSTFVFMNSFGQRWGNRGYFRATPDLLTKVSYGAYVMNNDTNSVWHRHPGNSVDNDHLNGPVVNEQLTLGEHQLINDVKFKLTRLVNDQSTATIQVFNSANDSLVQVLDMRANLPYLFYEDGDRIAMEFKSRSKLGRKFHSSIPIKVETRPDTLKDPYLEQRKAHLEKLHRSIIDPRH